MDEGNIEVLASEIWSGLLNKGSGLHDIEIMFMKLNAKGALNNIEGQPIVVNLITDIKKSSHKFDIRNEGGWKILEDNFRSSLILNLDEESFYEIFSEFIEYLCIKHKVFYVKSTRFLLNYENLPMKTCF